MIPIVCVSGEAALNEEEEAIFERCSLFFTRAIEATLAVLQPVPICRVNPRVEVLLGCNNQNAVATCSKALQLQKALQSNPQAQKGIVSVSNSPIWTVLFWDVYKP